jgi:GGDEF domain-containing protein
MAGSAVPVHEGRAPVGRMVSQREVPAALAVTGGIVLALGLVNAFLSGPFDVGDVVPDAVVAVLLLTGGYVLNHRHAGDAALSWSYAGAMTVVVLWLLNEFRFQPDTANMAYVVIVLAVFGPLTLAWAPFLSAATVMSGASLVVLISTGWGDARGWAAAYVVAVAVGSIMLVLRMRSLNELAAAREIADRLATADPESGVLNARGLELMSAVLVSTAKRHGQPLVVWCIQVEPTPSDADLIGRERESRDLAAVARALSESTREGDLVARLARHEFVVVGLGIEPARDPLLARVSRQLRAARCADHLADRIRSGSASRMPQVASVESLICEVRAGLAADHQLA